MLIRAHGHAQQMDVSQLHSGARAHPCPMQTFLLACDDSLRRGSLCSAYAYLYRSMSF